MRLQPLVLSQVLGMAAAALSYDPEYLAAVSSLPPTERPDTFVDVFELRNFTEAALYNIIHMLPTPVGITETKFQYKSLDNTTVNLYRFTSKEITDATKPGPAVVFAHGGGGISCSVDVYAPQIARYVADTGITFFAVDYRLAPEDPAPAAVDNVFAGLKYISSHASELNIDPKRIAVMGDSAGGGLAAGAALMARDKDLSPPLAKQILVYPMLDDRTKLPKGSPLEPFLIWKTGDNKQAWNAILGDEAGKEDADISIYAAPGRSKDLRDLPSTYVEVGGLDLFRAEDLSYASRIAAEDIEVELHLWPGLPHVYEVASEATIVKKALDARLRALKAF
ncbi:Abhydrolase-3 domain-containing protein [Fusarium falciforme]|uniref:Abhydrolase-3 domain-containing protein n=1 Tax=Fusarium falciforme TaxID=195108 RepID=UPI00230009EB|nr:Abhydrolase-3 domain-containing protein [Fusarium falciforme]WAO90315.1 Abhydrolase-3 domain-containing protein [Fusarium falciforme]